MLTALALTAMIVVDPPAGPAPGPAGRWADLVDEYQRWRDTAWPEDALASGRPTPTPDRIADRSIRGIESRRAQEDIFLDEMLEIDPATLPEGDRLGWQLLTRQLREGKAGHRFRTFLMPISGRGGPQQDIPQMAERVPLRTAEDWENLVKRLSAVPQMVRDTQDLLIMGLEEGRVPPRVTMGAVPDQVAAVAAGNLAQLRDAIAAMPAAVPEERRARLRAEADRWLDETVAELGALARFLRDTYLPACREGIAAADYPDGTAWYDHALREHTTTAMTAKEIHETGLAEVARIRAEMLEVISRTDWSTADAARAALPADERFAAFVEYLRTDPRFYARSEGELLTRYRDACKRIDAELPALFGTLPRNPYGVQAVPRFMAPTQTTAYYMPGSLRAGMPGWFYANTHALDQRPLYEVFPLSLHEAVPGHHLQVSLAQELDGQPEFRRDMHFTAFVEGWALYAERLGIEMGLYVDDPYADFGRLLYEMWRATRLVVDTGMHAFGWTRDRAVAFMRRNTALSVLNIEREIDRYIDWPGQATGYKIGELRIRAMRSRAEERLGDRFDVRAFHDAVLGAGAIPLDVLEDRIDRWITDRASAAAAGAAQAPAQP